MTEADDRVLVEAVSIRADEHAFGALYERHTPAMYGLALRLAGGSTSDAEDVVHDSWVRAVERLHEFEWRSALRSWLCGFVVRRWREVQRSRRRDAPGEDRCSESAAAATVDARLLSAVDRVDLERAIRHLSDGYREVLILHDVEGFTHKEIAALLGIDPGTSKSQLSRARRSLRHRLTDPDGTSDGS